MPKKHFSSLQKIHCYQIFLINVSFLQLSWIKCQQILLKMNDFLVKVREGTVKGVLKKNVEGGKYIVFQGIPYAAPPIGILRFQVISFFFFNKQYEFFIRSYFNNETWRYRPLGESRVLNNLKWSISLCLIILFVLLDNFYAVLKHML